MFFFVAWKSFFISSFFAMVIDSFVATFTRVQQQKIYTSSVSISSYFYLSPTKYTRDEALVSSPTVEEK